MSFLSCKSRSSRPILTNPFMRRTGFTLVELLIVVAIIALLATILLGALNEARAVGRRTKCLANLNQITKGWHAYQIDHKGAFVRDHTNDPFDPYPPPPENYQINYAGQQGSLGPEYRIRKPLNKWLGLDSKVGEVVSGARQRPDALLLQCPSDDGLGYARPSLHDRYGSSYLANQVLIGPNFLSRPSGDRFNPVWTKLNGQLARLSDSSIETAGRLLLFGDYAWWLDITNDPVVTADPMQAAWHGVPNRYSVSFFDGHSTSLMVKTGAIAAATYTVAPTKECDDLALTIAP